MFLSFLYERGRKMVWVPSSEWTQKDREVVIFAIAIQMRQQTMKMPLVPSAAVFGWSEKLQMLVGDSVTIEANREQLLEGLQLPEIR
jgi:hypothetical protein